MMSPYGLQSIVKDHVQNPEIYGGEEYDLLTEHYLTPKDLTLEVLSKASELMRQ